jgi:peptide-methionine (S)-S-oxide reductase
MGFFGSKATMVNPDQALAGRATPIFDVPTVHSVLGTPLQGPWPADTEAIYLALGCFWGAEELYWQLPGVYSTSVGYLGGFTLYPTYEEVCSGRTGHTEATLVVYRPAEISTYEILKTFWESHDPTQGYRQGNDIGTQYRGAIYYTNDAQRRIALATRDAYQGVISERGFGDITTEIEPASDFTYYFAEDYHQQYLYKHPNGYRCHANTGLALPPLDATQTGNPTHPVG